eukprot:jgi/Galph1/371/GphlegSOOS_G5044.1
MAGGKRPSNYARNSSRNGNRTSSESTGFFSLWNWPHVNFSPASQPNTAYSLHSSDEGMLPDSAKSSMGQGQPASSTSSPDEQEGSAFLGRTLEKYIEQTVERTCQQLASNCEVQLQRLQEEIRYLENAIRTEEESRAKLYEKMEGLFERMERVDKKLQDYIVQTLKSNKQGAIPSETDEEQAWKKTVTNDLETKNSAYKEEQVDGSLLERVKRLECELAEKCKVKGDSFTLASDDSERQANEGIVDRKDSKQNIQTQLSKLQKNMKKLEIRVDTALEQMEEASLMQSNSNEKLEQRTSQIDDLQRTVDAVKKLLEHNLRVQNDSESIVKEQADIIIKHVCAAMRQYTIKRINEYNIFLDSVLKKYLPGYQDVDSENLIAQPSSPEV